MTPVAIVGIACRLPMDANTGSTFWERLSAGFDAVTEWPEARESVASPMCFGEGEESGPIRFRGGYLRSPEEFDSSFFGLSPREAVRMDPEQRMVLEVAWDALEDA